MANYETHRNVGIGVTVITTASILLLINNDYKFLDVNLEMNLLTILLMIWVGILGSILPDIDLKTSRPSLYFRKITYLLTIIASIIFINNNEENLISITKEIDIYIVYPIFMLVGLFLNYIFIKIFENSMRHRGLVHSIPFAIVLSIILYLILRYGQETLNLNAEINSALVSLLLFVGFITHLILDELYSIDFNNRKIKKSFGSALSLFDTKNPIGSIILYIVIILFTNNYIISLI